MKRILVFAFCATFTLGAYAQQTVEITNFEDGLDWSYSGSSIATSLVEFSPILLSDGNETEAFEGENSLFVDYQATAEWNWSQLDFAGGALDLSGMREIRMWVYFDQNWEGQTDIRLDLPNGVGLGVQEAPSTGEWHELVWPIDRFTSENLTEVTHFGGFIAPGDGTANGILLIDSIQAVRPADVPEVETVQLYGFNELDPE